MATKSTFKCSLCEKTFAHKSSLSRHTQSCHDKENDSGSKNQSFWCCEKDCDCRYSSLISFLQHLQDKHNTVIAMKTMSFDSFSSFLEWKSEEETRTNSRYVQRCAPQTRGEGKTYYFYCNRSGTYKSKGKGKRSLKSQGSSKVDSYCSAHIKAKQSKDLRITIDYFSTHHNHKIEIAHLNIPNDIKLSIASKIQQGVTTDRILDDIRDSLCTHRVSREHLTNRRDILNIKKSLNPENIEKHKEDSSSVLAWVLEMKENEHFNPLLYFKQQGIEDDRGKLGRDDFLLCIQTEFQLEMLQCFGNNAVCIDATHGTNVYDFQLITLLVIDDYGEGIPVAWALSNKEDQVAITVFLEAVQSRCEGLKPTLFMSDDAQQYWSAWESVFGKNSTSKLLCNWHVDRAWRNALVRYVESTSERAQIYHQLHVLMLETSETEFTQMLQQFMSYLVSSHPEFAAYFRTYYVKRIAEWASCHRIGMLVNTNMHIEAFHRVLKYVYLNGKHNKRVDHLLHVLFKISRDKSFERIQKCHKGKMSHRCSELLKRHSQAEEMISKGVNPHLDGANTWKVPSQSSQATSYSVERVDHPCTCRMKCRLCGVCSQGFTCTCIDYAIHSTACKHIHCVCITQSSQQIHSGVSAPLFDISHAETSTSTQNPILQIENIRQKAKKKVDEVQLLLQNVQDADVLNGAYSHLSSAVLLLKSDKQTTGTLTPNSAHQKPHNSGIKVQRFYSTKHKKPRIDHCAMNKPTIEETLESRRLLQSIEPTVCSICYLEDDGQNIEEIFWTQCSTCPLWFHCSCIGCDPAETNYSCSLCTKK